VGNFQVVEVPLIARRITSKCLKFLLQAVHETGFLRAGEGPKNTKKKKLQCSTGLGIIHLLYENMDWAKGKLGKRSRQYL
jgi:hypothetical protein